MQPDWNTTNHSSALSIPAVLFILTLALALALALSLSPSLLPPLPLSRSLSSPFLPLPELIPVSLSW